MISLKNQKGFTKNKKASERNYELVILRNIHNLNAKSFCTFLLHFPMTSWRKYLQKIEQEFFARLEGCRAENEVHTVLTTETEKVNADMEKKK